MEHLDSAICACCHRQYFTVHFSSHTHSNPVILASSLPFFAIMCLSAAISHISLKGMIFWVVMPCSLVEVH
jgi:hypothetical protein